MALAERPGPHVKKALNTVSEALGSSPGCALYYLRQVAHVIQPFGHSELRQISLPADEGQYLLGLLGESDFIFMENLFYAARLLI